ncbi:hypothetical protein Tco_0506466 [Tanacetum coccineum]
MREGAFMGYKVNPDGLKECPYKVEAVLSLPSPKCLKVTIISKMDKNEAKLDKTEHGTGRAWENEAESLFIFNGPTSTLAIPFHLIGGKDVYVIQHLKRWDLKMDFDQGLRIEDGEAPKDLEASLPTYKYPRISHNVSYLV